MNNWVFHCSPDLQLPLRRTFQASRQVFVPPHLSFFLNVPFMYRMVRLEARTKCMATIKTMIHSMWVSCSAVLGGLRASSYFLFPEHQMESFIFFIVIL